MKKDNPLRNNPSDAFGNEANSLSRRGFLKRSGGATAASALAWSLTAKVVGATEEHETGDNETSCPEKDYKTNSGTYIEKIKDTYRRYKATGQSDIWLKTSAAPTLTGTQPPGNFVATFSRNGCTYTKTAKAPTVTKTPGSWSTSGSPPASSVTTLPEGPEWRLVNEKKEVTRTRNVDWQATQEYQRSGSCN